MIIVWMELVETEELEAFGVPQVDLVQVSDYCPHERDYWIRYKQFKVFCLSTTLLGELRNWGLIIMRLDYTTIPRYALNSRYMTIRIAGLFLAANQTIGTVSHQEACRRHDIRKLSSPLDKGGDPLSDGSPGNRGTGEIHDPDILVVQISERLWRECVANECFLHQEGLRASACLTSKP
jgi:hypothetical protein